MFHSPHLTLPSMGDGGPVNSRLRYKCGLERGVCGCGKDGSMVRSVEGSEGVEVGVGINGVVLVLVASPNSPILSELCPKKDLGVRVD